ncbi:MAG: type II toxin-antitoxin system RelE/ParE family toxin [Gammaproteobacteria bacterium]|nr:type II toxin-antitoxin system RelE/ParE family toxin [Gammaproteobacteria bacterium]
MIKTFACKDTESLYEGGTPRKFRAFKPQAERKLQMLDVAEDITDLLSPPGNRLEKLSSDRAGQWSIRVNNQWRICFEWRDNAPWNVEIIDYH